MAEVTEQTTVVEVPKQKEQDRKQLLKELVYERYRGRPIYYRGYREVLQGKKTVEEVMGSSKLQWFVIQAILRLLFANLDLSRFVVATNEAGFRTGRRSWRNLDIAVFDRQQLLQEGVDEKYVQTPPKVVIEVDTKADLQKYEDLLSYVIEKVQDLHQAGVERVVWILTRNRRVVIAEQQEAEWKIVPLDDEIELMEGIQCNVAALLRQEGVEL